MATTSNFYKKLLADPTRLDVLGNGHQRKCYVHIADCIDAMLHAVGSAHGKVSVANLVTHDYCEMNDSIGWITNYLGLSPTPVYTGDRGWVGDNRFIFLDTTRIARLAGPRDTRSAKACCRHCNG